jgi:hypothetical protein
VFQTLTLFTYLEEGFPIYLIASFALLLLLNWLLTSYRFILSHRPPDPYMVVHRVCYRYVSVSSTVAAGID